MRAIFSTRDGTNPMIGHAIDGEKDTYPVMSYHFFKTTTINNEKIPTMVSDLQTHN